MNQNFTCDNFECTNGQISDFELKSLLTCRENDEIEFVLIDIREMFEYSDLSIKGTDLLLPTSTLHLHMDKLEEMKNSFIIIYCRVGNRTGQMLIILERMGFKKIAHLSNGIAGYSGEKLKNASIPNQ